MPRKSSQKGMNIAIIVAIIGLVGTIITTLLSSPVLLKLMENPPTEAAVPPGEAQLVFSEDFEDGVASGFGFIIEDWAIIKDKSNKVLEVDSTPLTPEEFAWVATFGPADFGNGVLEFKIKYEEIGGFYTSFRIKDKAEYVLYLSGKGEIVTLSYNSEAQDWDASLLAENTRQYFSAQTGVWYTVRLEAQGSRMTIYLDGNKLFSADDPRLESGSLQFSMDPDTKVLLDDVKIWSFDQ